MNRFTPFVLLCTTLTLSSCEFNCSIGDKKAEAGRKTEYRDGIRLTNEIELQADGIKVDKAYLIFADGSPVPDGNIVDFAEPVQVKIVMVIDKGWEEKEGKVFLGASERIEIETGEVLLDEKDLFEQKLPEGMSPEDARIISLTASLKLNQKIKPLTTFYVIFKVWDKVGKGFIQGRYKLYSK